MSPEAVRHVFLSENTSFGTETGAGIMRNRCAFTSRDMAADWPEAFTYAIVTGWDTDPAELMEGEADGAMEDVAAKFGWDPELVAFLRDAHERFKALADKRPAPPEDGLANVLAVMEEANGPVTQAEIDTELKQWPTE